METRQAAEPKTKLLTAIVIPIIVAVSVVSLFLPKGHAAIYSTLLSILGVFFCVVISFYLVTTYAGLGFQAIGFTFLASSALTLVAELLSAFAVMGWGDESRLIAIAAFFWILGYLPLLYLGISMIWEYHDYLAVRRLLFIFLAWFMFFIGAILPVIVSIFSGSFDVVTATAYSAYPLLDSLLLLILMVVMEIYRKAQLLVYWRFLTIGVALFAIGDILTAHFETQGIYYPGSLPDVFLVMSSYVIAFGLAIMLQIRGLFIRVEPTGEYAIDHVFLLYMDGSLVSHAISDRASKEVDGNRIIQMLIGIQDFVKESFVSGKGAQLDELKLGERTFMFQKGDKVVLVAGIHGRTTPDIRKRMGEMVNNIESSYRKQLSIYVGDSSKLSETKDILVSLLTK